MMVMRAAGAVVLVMLRGMIRVRPVIVVHPAMDRAAVVTVGPLVGLLLISLWLAGIVVLRIILRVWVHAAHKVARQTHDQEVY